MQNSKDKRKEEDGVVYPSAPPLPPVWEDAQEHPLAPRTFNDHRRRSLSRSHVFCFHMTTEDWTEDSDLVRNLLIKADGDTSKAAAWLKTIDETVPDDELQNELARCKDMMMREDDVDAVADQLGAPETFFCPISRHLFRDPVFLMETGQTYERIVIERWLAEGGSICPNTGVGLTTPVQLKPNIALRKAVEEWASKNAPWMLDGQGNLRPIPDHIRRHFSVAEERVSTDRDAALALQLQQEELAQQQQRRNQRRGRTRGHEMTQAQYDRMRRSIFLFLLLTVLYVAFFIFTFLKSDWKFEKIDSNPLVGFEARVLRRVGCTDTYLISNENEWWRLVTSAMMTGGIVHLQWVVFCLWIFGRFLAHKMSFISLSLLYIVSSLCGVLVSANLSPTSDTVSGSSGVCGLISATMIEVIVHRKQYQNLVFSMVFALIPASIGVAIGLTPFVDNWACLGGFVGGILMALGLRLTYRGLQRFSRWMECIYVAVQVLCFALVALLLTAGCVGLAINQKRIGEDCHWCKHLTCVETKWWNCDAAVLPPDQIVCKFVINGDSTVIITCPSGLVDTIQTEDYSDNNLDRYCKAVCRKEESSNGPPSNGESRTGYLPNEPSDSISSLEEGNIEQSTTQ